MIIFYVKFYFRLKVSFSGDLFLSLKFFGQEKNLLRSKLLTLDFRLGNWNWTDKKWPTTIIKELYIHIYGNSGEF